MTKGITEKEPDPRIVYADIINLPHHQSATRPHMSLYDRAAQFAPFAALTGYDEMVNEEARYVDQQIEQDEASLELLNQKLTLIADVIEDGMKPTVSITYFEPDTMKLGGKYVTATEKIKKIDPVARKVILMKKSGVAGLNATIDIDRITEIYGDLVDYMDDGTE